jgi:hypothetical protein
LCDELGIAIPEWLSHVPPCREPYFVSETDGLMAFGLLEAPPYFRIRKVFVMENFLHRV